MARLKTHDNNGFPLKKWYSYKSLSSRAFFGQWGITAFSEKSYHKKAPHRPTKNNNQTKVSRVQKIVHLKSPILARLSDGSGAAQFALKHRGELLSPQARKTSLRAPLLAWRRVLRTNFAVRQKSIGDIPSYTLALYHICSVLSIKANICLYFILVFQKLFVKMPCHNV